MFYKNSILFLLGLLAAFEERGVLEAADVSAQAPQTTPQTLKTLKEKGKEALEWVSENPQTALPLAGIGVAGAVGAGVTGVALYKSLKQKNSAAPVPAPAAAPAPAAGNLNTTDPLVQEQGLLKIQGDSFRKEEEGKEKESEGGNYNNSYNRMELRELFNKIVDYDKTFKGLSQNNIFSPEEVKGPSMEDDFDIEKAKNSYRKRIREFSKNLKEEALKDQEGKDPDKIHKAFYVATHLSEGEIHVPFHINDLKKFEKHLEIMGHKEKSKELEEEWIAKRKMLLSTRERQNPGRALEEKGKFIKDIEDNKDHPLSSILEDLKIINEGEHARLRATERRNPRSEGKNK